MSSSDSVVTNTRQIPQYRALATCTIKAGLEGTNATVEVVSTVDVRNASTFNGAVQELMSKCQWVTQHQYKPRSCHMSSIAILFVPTGERTIYPERMQCE